MKKITISVLAALSLCCVGGGALALNASTPAVAKAETDTVYMLGGGSVRLSNPSGLGFLTRIEYDYYNELVSNNYEVKTGTILLPTDYLTDAIDLTSAHASLNANNVVYLDVENNGFKNSATAQKDDYYEFRGSIAPVHETNENRLFSAVGYVATKATEETAEYTYVYTAYDESKHSRTLENVAYDAFVDRNAEYDEEKKYIYKVEADGTYSPYPTDKLDILAGFMKETVLTGTAIVEETANTLDAAALSTAFTAQNFVADEITAITHYGAEVSLNNGIADVSKNGIYDVTLSGTYTNDKGVKIPAKMNAEVDVWSADTKYTVAGAEELTSVGGYAYQSLAHGIEASNTYTLGNKTAYMTRFTPKETDVFFFRPMHSKAYYQMLLDNQITYSTSYITMDWYFEQGSKTSEFVNYFSMFEGYVKNAPALNTWVNYEMSLSNFVDMYDSILAYYETTMAEIEAGTKFGRYSATYGAVDQQGNKATGYLASGAISGRAEYSYLSDITIIEKASAYEETTLLVDRNAQTSVDLSAHTEEGAKVLDYWKNNGYALTYDLTARYGGADWNGENEKTFTITENAESGIYNLKVTANKGNVSNVCLTRMIDVYNSTEPVEYESFRHTDSQYAVLSYFGNGAWFSALNGTNWAMKPDAPIDIAGVDHFLSADTIREVKFKGTGSEENTYYALSLGTSSSNAVTNFKGKTVGYMEYDWGVGFTKSSDTGYSYIMTYVLPRHTVDYYKLYQESHGKFAISFRGTYVNTTTTGTKQSLRTLTMAGIADGKVQLFYGRTESNNDQGGGLFTNTNANIQTLINNYDSYATAQVPMQIIYYPDLYTAGTARLYEIFFVANA